MATRARTVHRHQERPWGWIGALVGVVVLCGALVAYLLVQGSHRVDPGETIQGVQDFEYTVGGLHTNGEVDYKEKPAVGGEHNPVWADCTGTVYPDPVPDENAVHSLEHGAVWVTYRPDLPGDEVAALAALVQGVPYTLMSPYPGLDAAVSVQSWNHQLKLQDPDTKKVQEYIVAYKEREDSPEPGASCVNPDGASMDTDGSVQQ